MSEKLSKRRIERTNRELKRRSLELEAGSGAAGSFVMLTRRFHAGAVEMTDIFASLGIHATQNARFGCAE